MCSTELEKFKAIAFDIFLRAMFEEKSLLPITAYLLWNLRKHFPSEYQNTSNIENLIPSNSNLTYTYFSKFLNSRNSSSSFWRNANDPTKAHY